PVAAPGIPRLYSFKQLFYTCVVDDHPKESPPPRRPRDPRRRGRLRLGPLAPDPARPDRGRDHERGRGEPAGRGPDRTAARHGGRRGAEGPAPGRDRSRRAAGGPRLLRAQRRGPLLPGPTVGTRAPPPRAPH